MKVKFWGTRGSIPVPGVETAIYGGNTTCLEVRLEDNTLIIFDAGTGIRNLGREIMARNNTSHVNLVLTHSHWDHIQGFPFFGPANNPDVKIDILGCPGTYFKLRKILTDQMEFKYFPLTFDALKSKISFKEISENVHPIGTAKLSFIELNHPGTTYGFRLIEDNSSFAFLTDNELKPPPPINTPWQNFIKFCENLDLLVHDAMWTNDELQSKRGWGHSSMEQVIELADHAHIKKVVFFHHLPERTDAELLQVFNETLQKMKPRINGTSYFLAKEGDEYLI